MRRLEGVVPLVLGSLLVAAGAGAVFAQSRASAVKAAPARTVQQNAAAQSWIASGGEVGVRWNRDLARDLGIDIAVDGVRGTPAQDGSERFAVATGALWFRVGGGYLRGFDGGAVRASGGYALTLPGGRIDLRDFRLVPQRGGRGQALRLDLVGADGTAWLYVDRIMHEVFDGTQPALTVSSSDLRIAAPLARRLGRPFVAGWTIGEVQLELPITTRGGGFAPLADTIRWHGDPAPGGGIYQNDLFMTATSAQYVRCQGCTGENGSGSVVITPSSTLRNNVNEGSIEATVPGDPLGTSTARHTASIPWYQKFTAPSPPYGNDQHPFLIWNMYRVNADGSLEQIGRSGVKQAFLTINVGCLDANDHNSHVLGRGCSDTYSVSNNDSANSLSPRSEILPSRGQWARCGSTFDTDCNGVGNGVAEDGYTQRMIVNEAQIAPSRNPGASWLFESWYLAREDIDIYNSMSTLKTTQQRSGNVWNVGSGDERLGSAIDRWFAMDAPARSPRLVRRGPGGSPGAGADNRLDRPDLVPPEDSTGSDRIYRPDAVPKRMIKEVVVDGAHAKVAVKAIKQPDGSWRYHYAVMNFDFAFAQTQGTEPNLRMIQSRGFNSFGLSTGSASEATDAVFRDGDLDSGNDWQFDATGFAAVWTLGTDAANTLSWGVLHSYSLTSPYPPVYGTATLLADVPPGPYRTRTMLFPVRYDIRILVPGSG